MGFFLLAVVGASILAIASPILGALDQRETPRRVGDSEPKSEPNLSAADKTALIVVALLVLALLAVYVAWPPHHTTVTIQQNAQRKTTQTVTRTETQRGDVVIIAAVGFAAILFLTAALDGRVKFVAPGGAGVEVAAKALATADDAIDRLQKEVERLRKVAGGSAGAADPELEPTLQRWSYLKSRFRLPPPGS